MREQGNGYPGFSHLPLECSWLIQRVAVQEQRLFALLEEGFGYDRAGLGFLSYGKFGIACLDRSIGSIRVMIIYK